MRETTPSAESVDKKQKPDDVNSIRLPMACIVYTPDLVVLDWNSTAKEIFGYTKTEAIGSNILDLIIPDDLFSAVELWKATMENHTVNTAYSFRNITKRNQTIFCNWHTQKFTDENEKSYRFISFAEPIINNENRFSFGGKNSLNDHTDSDQQFNAVFNLQTRQFDYMNPEFLRTLSLVDDENDRSAESILKFIPVNERFRLIRHFLFRSQKNKAINIIFNLSFSQFITRCFHLTGGCYNVAGKGYLVLNARILNDDSLEQLRLGEKVSFPNGSDHLNLKLLQHRNNLEILGDLTSGIVHEINQPLGVVKIVLDNIRLKIESGSLTKDHLEKKCGLIDDNLKRIGELIEEIRIFRKDIRQKNVTFVNLSKSVYRTLELFKMNLANNDIRLKREIDKEIPHIIANEKWLMIIITNLLINAKHSLIQKSLRKDNPAGFRKEIKISVWYDDEKVYLEVWDNGNGIKEKYLTRIFSPFFSTKGDSGSGIGLAIVKNYVTEMNGAIEVDSREHAYASFKVSFPRVD